MKRITAHPVLEVKTRQEVDFTFDGHPVKGLEGEPVSSALFANGIKQFSIHKKDDAPQGIFCANGQCSQCTVIIDGMPLKSCVTPLKAGMDVRTLVHIPELPHDDEPGLLSRIETLKTDVVVIGGGPSGLTSAIELAKLGFDVTIVEDKE
ncbi:MAG: FAD-dependent oxidoreductase, partial [Candidatus Delongbacteria bacterium]